MNDWICPIWIYLQRQLSKFLLALLVCFFVRQKARPVKYFLLPLALACFACQKLLQPPGLSISCVSQCSQLWKTYPISPKTPLEKQKKKRKEKRPLKSLNPSRGD